MSSEHETNIEPLSLLLFDVAFHLVPVTLQICEDKLGKCQIVKTWIKINALSGSQHCQKSKVKDRERTCWS